MRGRPRTEQQTTPVNVSPHRLRSHRRQLPSQKPPPHALWPIPDTVVNAEEPEEPEPIQVLPLPLLFPPIQTPMPCALQLISGTIVNAEEHKEHFPVLPLLCSPLSGPLCCLVHSLQTECYSAEDTLYQYLMPEGKLYPSL